MSGAGGPGNHHLPSGDGGGESLDEDTRREYEAMERWLDDHPAFLHAYFARKGRESLVNAWLISHALSGVDNLSTPSAESTSGTSSGANTPVRKISAQEFERGGILNPMVNTVDGLQTFIGTASTSSTPTQPRSRRRSKSELMSLDEKQLMHELVMDICNDLDVTSLCFKILQNMCILLNADRCSLFLVKGTSEKKYLVSTLFDVTCDSEFESVSTKAEEIQIPFGKGISGYVAENGLMVNIANAYEDPRFSDEIDKRMGYKTRSILSMPIKDSEGEVIGVAQAINKISAKDEPFDEHDEKVFGTYLAFCGIGLKNAQLYEKSLLENFRNQVLLELARSIFEEQRNVASLIRKIMSNTRHLLRCDRCQVLLVEDDTKEFPSQVYDFDGTDIDNEDPMTRERTHAPRFPTNPGITGYVASTGEALNIPDAYQDNRFDQEVDKGTDFKTHAILCMPIKDVKRKVIGVIQLVNKQDGTAFNKNDENLIEAFAIFCGMGIHNTQMFEQAVRAVARQKIALEVMSYHAIASEEDAIELKKTIIPSVESLKILDFGFSDFKINDDTTIKATVRMFLDLDLLQSFQIDYLVFCRWILSVKKNYRNVIYHNWRHAFNVTQTMFCMLEAGEMKNILTTVERLALMVGCLCHDLDHRGTNNQFQKKTMSPLAELYSTSTMEHHHFDQCIMILTTKGSDIFRNLSQETYSQVINLLKSAILATDLALYFSYRPKFEALIATNNSDWSNEDHRNLLRSMMMTASDVAAITKPWEDQKKIAALVASEFFEQGDIEKKTLNLTPIPMMDRAQSDKLPDLQVGFIDDICMPVYKAISKVSPKLNPLLEGCQQNRNNWYMQSKAVRKRLDERKKENVDKDKYEYNEKNEHESREKSCDDGGKEKNEDEDMELEEDEDTVVENFSVNESSEKVKGNADSTSKTLSINFDARKYLSDKAGDCMVRREEDRISQEDRALLLMREDSQHKRSNSDKWKHKESEHHFKQESGKFWPRGAKGSSKASSSKRRMFSCRERPHSREDDKSSTS
ncbi:dual 3',5'-cyclic-AMP and -GMP phosphodiesterase 11-like isoform X2 [Biomphalaria glabrata]|uniref:Phosphodiesterase n=1 Tax=Biomphalaria glabrata TaxID=6526 RepID=A0A9W2ZJ08_BIOGL|nr:dual 3',5'-cyclic-AMP and -GMP phosphodiesterase 11-like isoform X2 [Biomphalaria glabrata]